MSDEKKKSYTFFKFNPYLMLHPQEIGGAETKLMIFLCYAMDFKNCIILDQAQKEFLCEMMQVKEQELNRLLKLLEKKQLIFKKEFRIFISEQFAKKGK